MNIFFGYKAVLKKTLQVINRRFGTEFSLLIDYNLSLNKHSVEIVHKDPDFSLMYIAHKSKRKLHKKVFSYFLHYLSAGESANESTDDTYILLYSIRELIELKKY